MNTVERLLEATTEIWKVYNKHPYEIKPICFINPRLPKELEYIVSKCIEQDPNKRY